MGIPWLANFPVNLIIPPWLVCSKFAQAIRPCCRKYRGGRPQYAIPGSQSPERQRGVQSELLQTWYKGESRQRAPNSRSIIGLTEPKIARIRRLDCGLLLLARRMPTKTLVIGAAGAVGKRLCAALQRAGSEVIAADRMKYIPSTLRVHCSRAVGGVDVRDKTAVAKLFRQHADADTAGWNLASPLSVETAPPHACRRPPTRAACLDHQQRLTMPRHPRNPGGDGDVTGARAIGRDRRHGERA